MKRRTYPKYKDSGIPWIEEIPGHWHVERLKHVSSVQLSNVDKVSAENEIPVRLCNYVDVYYNDFIHEALDFMSATATRDEIRRFRLRQGDVLITKDSESWDDIAVPACVVEEQDNLLCGYHLAQIRPNSQRLDGRYLFRAFCARGINDQFRVAATGVTRFGLGKYWIDNGIFPLPPLPEQRAIAAFLDRETARIDGLIEKKQRQIELLQEKRAALISSMVSGQLSIINDPETGKRRLATDDEVRRLKKQDCSLIIVDCSLKKPSGIEWLGDVPEHWEVKRLKFSLKSIEQGWSPQCEARQIENDTEWGVLKVGCVNGDCFDDSEHKALPANLEPTPRYEIKVGDILMSRANTRELLGSAAYVHAVRPHLLLCDKLYRIRANPDEVDARYLVLAFRSRICRFHFERDADGTSGSMKNIGQETVKDTWIPLPPVCEQRALVERLTDKTNHIDHLIEKTTHSISMLREYRTALISAAVTGKIKVTDE